MEVAQRFKLVLVGDSNVGKTTFMQRVRDPLSATALWNTKATVGAEFVPKTYELEGGGAAQVTLWDTAGQERYRSVTKSYYRGTDCFLLVYDISNRTSFMHLMNTWLPDIGTDVTKVALIGNKADLEETRQVKAEEAAALCRAKGWFFAELASEAPGARASQIVDEIYRLLAVSGPPKASPQRTLSLTDARSADGEPSAPVPPASWCRC